MDAVIDTKNGREYEMLSGILEYEMPGIIVSQGVMDGSFHLEHGYDIVAVGVDGALGMELVCKYRELYGSALVIWITDDSYFAGVAIRTRIFDFIVRPLEGARFREAVRRIVEGDIAVWQRMPVRNSVYQTGCACGDAYQTAADILGKLPDKIKMQAEAEDAVIAGTEKDNEKVTDEWAAAKKQ